MRRRGLLRLAAASTIAAICDVARPARCWQAASPGEQFLNRTDLAAAMSLSCELVEPESALRVAFRVRNEGARPVGILHRIGARTLDGGLRFAAEHAFVILEDKHLHLRKLAPPASGAGHALCPGVGALSYLAPGETLVDTMRLALPFAVCDPQRRRVLAQAFPDEWIAAVGSRSTERIRLSVGAIDLGDGTDLIPLSPAYPDLHGLRAEGSIEHRLRVITRTLALPSALPVLDYRVVAPPRDA